MDSYQKSKGDGLDGHRSEQSWDRKKKEHSCCGSKTWYRHRVNCPRATGDGKLPPE